MEDIVDIVSSAPWTAEDSAIINGRKRSNPNRADELFGDKCDGLRMMLLAKPRLASQDPRIGRQARREQLAFGGLSPSEILDTSALDAARFNENLRAERIGNRQCPDCGYDQTPGARHQFAGHSSDCPQSARAERQNHLVEVEPSKRIRRCQVGLAGWNPPSGHELLPQFICDVRTRQGSWAWFCPACAAAFGVGFGLGKGQRFVNDKSMRKVEG